MKQDSRCSAIVLAHNVFALDLPADGSLLSLRGFADEIILVVPRCSDETLDWAYSLQEGTQREIKVIEAPTLPLNYQMPERVWKMGMDWAHYPWLCDWKLHWGMHAQYGPWLKQIMGMPTPRLLNLTMHNLYGTPGWKEEVTDKYNATLIGHRDVNFRVACGPDDPVRGHTWGRRATIGDVDYWADDFVSTRVALLEAPVLDFYGTRNARAVAATETLYRETLILDNPAYADWHLPVPAPHNFDIRDRVRSGKLAPYDWGEIPDGFQVWCDLHQADWVGLDAQARTAWEGRLL